MIRTYFIFGFLWAFLIFDMNAQVKLNLNEAIDLALKQNINIAKEDNNLKASVKSKVNALARVLPSINLRGEGFNATGRNFDQTTGVVRTETGEFVNGAANVNWNILNFLENYSRIRMSNNDRHSREFNLEATRELTTLNVINSYLQILQSIKQDSILQKFYDTQETNLDRTQKMIDIGSLPGQDYYTQKAELSRIKSLQIANNNIVENAKRELLLILNLPANTDLQLEDHSVNSEAFDNENDDLQSLYNSALINRKDLKSLEFDVKSKKNQISVSRSSYYPNIRLFYNYGSNYSSFADPSFNDQFFDLNITQTYGLAIQIPIFNGLNSRTEVYRSVVEFKNANLDLEQFKNNVLVEIANVKGNIKAAEETKIYREEQMKATKVAYELQKEKYYLGDGTPLDLTLAQRDYIEATLLLNQINYQLIYNRFEQDYFAGNISVARSRGMM
ncbi:TolC family protein [Aquimarina spongiae]|uniref:Outer membrane protein TolC n=1 Tax=Aquimarina spongiae TaxID=570521 RepID=A0A1M6H1A1_9FLAO|nr:TolC family protein [Aquimarina spongiae]SHJ16010.1 Outer membrane protein TolC [Aquimarina spongiae]